MQEKTNYCQKLNSVVIAFLTGTWTFFIVYKNRNTNIKLNLSGYFITKKSVYYKKYLKSTAYKPALEWVHSLRANRNLLLAAPALGPHVWLYQFVPAVSHITCERSRYGPLWAV